MKKIIVQIQTSDWQVNEMRLSYELDFEAYLKTMQNLACVELQPVHASSTKPFVQKV